MATLGWMCLAMLFELCYELHYQHYAIRRKGKDSRADINRNDHFALLRG